MLHNHISHNVNFQNPKSVAAMAEDKVFIHILGQTSASNDSSNIHGLSFGFKLNDTNYEGHNCTSLVAESHRSVYTGGWSSNCGQPRTFGIESPECFMTGLINLNITSFDARQRG